MLLVKFVSLEFLYLFIRSFSHSVEWDFLNFYFLVVDEQKELQLEVERLKQIVQKQREELRSVEKDLDQKHTTTEMVSALLEFCSERKFVLNYLLFRSTQYEYHNRVLTVNVEFISHDKLVKTSWKSCVMKFCYIQFLM